MIIHSYKIFLLSILILLNNISYADIIPYNSDRIEANYAKAIKEHRNAEDKSFRDKKTTLLSKEYFPRFTGLSYFPANLKYQVIGRLTPLSKKESTNLEMTHGGPYGFIHYGKVNFYLEGMAVELQVYEFPSNDPEIKSIFVPFTDKTTGKESYGGGRFMIIQLPESEQIVIDFNLSINPICVYDPEHACPVPPRSNRIKKSISAGVKMYHDPNETIY